MEHDDSCFHTAKQSSRSVTAKTIMGKAIVKMFPYR
jgi:hypothetical protein